jgi:hypothetical protein
MSMLSRFGRMPGSNTSLLPMNDDLAEFLFSVCEAGREGLTKVQDWIFRHLT